MQEVIRGAPLLTEHLDPESHAHFDALCGMLRAVGVSYEINPRLDAASITTTARCSSGSPRPPATNAVCSGGRYDGLIAQLGGDATPRSVLRWAWKRLVALMQAAGGAVPRPRRTCTSWSAVRRPRRRPWNSWMRRAVSGPVAFRAHLGGGNFKAQFRRADKSGAPLASDHRRR